jgi:ABC-2 type transport system permease protein
MKTAIIVLQEIKAMLREKSFLLIILLELLLVSSSGLLSIGYGIITSPESSSTLSQLNSLVYVGVVTDSRQYFPRAFEKGRVHYVFYDSFPLAYEDFKEGVLDSVIYGDITPDEKPAVLNIFIPSNSPKAPLTKLAMKSVMLALEDDIRTTKVRVYAKDLEFAPYQIMNYKPQARYIEIYFIFTLPLLLFLPCIVSGSLAIDSITQDLESRRMLNLVVAPLTNNQIVFGKSLASLALSVAQSAAWLLTLSLTFVNPQNHVVLVLFCALYTIIFMNVGSLLALYLRKMRNSQIIYTFVSMSAISLFSPFANIHPLLLDFSPSYILARTALGAPPTVFAWQIIILILMAAGSTALIMFSSKKICEI